jgi:hypothetical protein
MVMLFPFRSSRKAVSAPILNRAQRVRKRVAVHTSACTTPKLKHGPQREVSPRRADFEEAGITGTIP